MQSFPFYIERERDISLHGYCWMPPADTDIKGLIQIAHGMAEHILRYEAFACYLANQGFIIYGNDHRGHGNSIIAPDDKGFFAEENGFSKVVEDLRAVTTYMKEQHPTLPLFFFGHSLGSFLTRRYMQLYGDSLSGVILSGTGMDQGISSRAGYLLAKWDRLRKGPRTPSPLMDRLIFGTFNKPFAPARTDFDFLSRDVAAVDLYIQDSRCGFICSTSFYMDLLSGIALIHRPKEIAKTPKQLPILFISGDQDPVGDFGKGVMKVADMYRNIGVKDVHLTLYPGGRHEMLHEINAKEVQHEIKQWLDNHVEK